MPQIHDAFNPVEVDTSGTNLIEASAGTGKTYSIAMLALRLIIEQGLTVDQVLMVTFTRDAAAEMQLRVRSFIRQALQIAEGRRDGADAQIAQIVDRVPNPELASARLKNALLQFDQSAIFTIHGFCARVLAEHAFESGQLFTIRTLDPAEMNDLIADAFNQAWRNQVTTLDERLLVFLRAGNFSRSLILSLVKTGLSGKKIHVGEKPEGQSLQDYWEEKIQQLNRLVDPSDGLAAAVMALNECASEVSMQIQNKKQGWIQAATASKDANVRKKVPELLKGSPDESFGKIIKASDKKYFHSFFDADAAFSTSLLNVEKAVGNLEDIKTRIKKYGIAFQSLNSILTSILAAKMLQEVECHLYALKKTNAATSFDDMIEGLHRTICKPEPGAVQHAERLKAVLRKRYRAVFIDEFQDTDPLQFEIFRELFLNDAPGSGHAVFFIGDPKQSIYAFRKADLQTYFHAATLVEHIWRMNTNYRSTKGYISAMNHFFRPGDQPFDVFRSVQMEYYPVQAALEARTGHLLYRDRELQPLRVICCGNKGSIHNQTVRLVRLLLGESFQICINDQKERIRAGRIGILVRTKKEGRILRERLSGAGIAAVTLSDTGVFETVEAKDLLYILKAVEDISAGNINRALMTGIIGFSWKALNTMDEEKLLLQFRSYQDLWKKSGVYVMFRKLLRDCRAIHRKLDGTLLNSDRVLSNTLQLMEMLHEAETDHHFSAEELIYWLQKGIEGGQQAEDEYLQRIERDESAVKIVTLHSCKGLEYDIVIAPYLDMTTTNDRFETTQFREPDGYYTADKKVLTPALLAKAQFETEQENLRLLYVAITRARYHCYVLSSNEMERSKKMNSSLKYIQHQILADTKTESELRFIGPENTRDAIKNHPTLFEPDAPELNDPSVITREEAPEIRQFADLPQLSLPDRYWQKSSYTALKPENEYRPVEYTAVTNDEYDQFVFGTLRRGVVSGNMIHALLERVDFRKDTHHQDVVRQVMASHSGAGVRVGDEEKMVQLLNHVLGTTLPVPEGAEPFMLNRISRRQRLSELEFDMPLKQIDWNEFPEKLDNGNIPIRIRNEQELNGILNGKIDLFFEEDGRYYLVDWKSNHLGNQPDDYTPEKLALAMEANNFHLQYYLYCLALYRYLCRRIPGFDYEKQFGGVYYLFVRGMRIGNHSGIYHHKPLLEDILRLEECLLVQLQ